jgi:hypothetical protein
MDISWPLQLLRSKSTYRKKLSYHEGCDQAIWYWLQLKIKNIGNEEIRGFYLLGNNEPALVDSGGGGNIPV